MLATIVAVALTLADVGAGAQRPPMRTLGPVVATSAPYDEAYHVVGLSDGRVLIHDRTARRVVLVDTNLANPQVVLDSAQGRDNSYGGGGFLLGFRADSSLFLELTTNAFLVIDPAGRIARVMAGPSVSSRTGAIVTNRALLHTPSLGVVFALDQPPGYVIAQTRENTPKAGDPDFISKWEDSSIVLALDPSTRATDTLARISSGRIATRIIRAGGGMGGGGKATALFPFIDEMAVMRDGTLAIFRSRDYRVEWIAPDGSRSSSPRLDYPWQLMTDDRKQAIVDSINADRRAAYDSVLVQRAVDSAAGRLPMRTVSMLTDAGAVPRQVPVAVAEPPERVSVSEIPDFLPPTTRRSFLGDADNNVWIRPKLPADSVASGDIYDVVDRKGAVVDRVRVPIGKTVAGFLPGHVLLLVREGGTVRVEKVRWK